MGPPPARIANMSKTEIQYVSDMLYSFNFMNGGTVYLCPDGIHLIHSKSETESVHSYIYKWDYFKITGFYNDKNNQDEVIPRYHFWLNKICYFSKNWNEIIHILQERCLQTSGKKDLIRDLLYQYIKNEPIPELILSDVMGFTVESDGWCMPDEFHAFRFKGVERSKLKIIDALINQPWKGDEITRFCKQFTDLYYLTTIPYKDIDFAYAMISTFQHVLMTITQNIKFILYLHSPDQELGKSAILKLISKGFFNLNPVNGGQLTNATMRQNLQCMTFPIDIDEFGNLRSECLDTLKSNFSIPGSQNEKLGGGEGGQEISSNGELTGALMASTNRNIEAIQDPPFRSRMLIESILNYQSQNKDEWGEARLQFEDGLFLRCLYYLTHDWHVADIAARYKKQDCLGYTGRSALIARELLMGADLWEELFHIRLNKIQLIIDIHILLQETAIAGTDLLLSCMNDQLHDTAHGTVPHGWVKTPILYNKPAAQTPGKNTKKIYGHGWKSTNVLELSGYLYNEKLTLDDFLAKIRALFPHAVKRQILNGNERPTCVYIPIEDWDAVIEPDVDIPDIIPEPIQTDLIRLHKK